CLPGSPWRKHLQASGIRSLIAAPVLVQRKPLGVATFYSEDRSGLTSNDSRLLQVALRQAGAAMANARLFADLQTHRRILGRLSSRILTAQEEERQHLSRELHDGIGQSLSALKLGLEMLSGDHPERRSRSLQEDLSQALEIVTETIAELRRISQDLRPPILDDLGLLPTLRWLANRFQVQTGLEVQIEVEGEERTLTPQQDVNLYRIAQESLANVSRHAHATSVRIHVLWDSTTVQLRITDNGAGFQPGAGDGGPPGGGLGMASIKERANLMGGRFRVKSRPHKGTTLEVEIPFHSHTGEHPKSVAGT
ncbi:MAG: histidine kinase, partial [Acidobacteriota bacterium]